MAWNWRRPIGWKKPSRISIKPRISKPLPANADAEAQYARLYITARDYWNVNWEKAIESFGELYRLGPGYRDTFARYVEAYIQYGDERIRAGDPCNAQTQYEAALQLRPAPALQEKADKSKEDLPDRAAVDYGHQSNAGGLVCGPHRVSRV